jgi:hypothetical protein
LKVKEEWEQFEEGSARGESNDQKKPEPGGKETGCNETGREKAGNEEVGGKETKKQ